MAVNRIKVNPVRPHREKIRSYLTGDERSGKSLNSRLILESDNALIWST
jgi:hypothetical protein